MPTRAKLPELEELHAFGCEVARELGWHYDVLGSREREGKHLMHYACIRPGLTAYSVRLQADWRVPQMIECVGDIPSQDKEGTYRHTYSGSLPRIRVRRDRGARAVAREIKRRLLPIYTPLYEKAQKSLADDNAYIDVRDRALEALVVFGRRSHDRGDRQRIYLDVGDHGIATVSTRGITLEVTCTVEQASQILQFLRDDSSV